MEDRTNQTMKIFLQVWRNNLTIKTLLKLERVNTTFRREIKRLDVWRKRAIQLGYSTLNLNSEEIKERLLNTEIRAQILRKAQNQFSHFSSIHLDRSSTIESYREKCDWVIPKNCCIGSLMLSAATEVIGIFSACLACSCYPCCGSGCTSCLTTLYPGCFRVAGGSCCTLSAGGTSFQCCAVPTYTCTKMTIVGHGVTWGTIPALLCVGMTLSFSCHYLCHSSPGSVRIQNIHYVEGGLEESKNTIVGITKKIKQYGIFNKVTHPTEHIPQQIKMDETTPLLNSL